MDEAIVARHSSPAGRFDRTRQSDVPHWRYALLSYNLTNNIGDHIQSIAARSFLPRIDDQFDRDAIGEYDPSFPTRVICNGWFMHSPERFGIGKNVEPLFISFHVTPTPGLHGFSRSFAEVLTSVPEYRDVLNRFGPVGARDLFTWKLLRDLGVNTYFSGCLTLALPATTPGDNSDDIVLVDVHPSIIERVRKQSDRRVIVIRHGHIAPLEHQSAMQRAEELLSLYSKAHLVITSRLHVTMPCLARNRPVILVGDHLEDPRFSGLKDLCKHMTNDQFAVFPRELLEHPEPNPNNYLTLRRELVEQVTAFVGDGFRAASNERHAGYKSTAWALARHLDTVNRQLELRAQQAETQINTANENALQLQATLNTVRGERDAAIANMESGLSAARAEVDQQRRQLEDRDAALTAAQSQMAEGGARLAAALSEIADQTALVSVVERERDERLAELHRAEGVARETIAKLCATVEERSAALQRTLDESETLHSKIADQRTLITDVVRERDERLAELHRVEETAGETIANLRAAVDERSAALQRTLDEAEILRVEIADQTALVTAVKQERDERLAVLLRAEETAGETIANLRAAVDERSAALQRTLDEAEILRAEIADQRTIVALVERGRIEESAKLRLAMGDIAILRQTLDADTAAAKALEAEAVALREQVAAAQKVGRELLAALLADTTTKLPLLPPNVKRSWWRRTFSPSLVATRTA